MDFLESEGNSISGGPPPKEVIGSFDVKEKTETTVMLVGEKGICKFVDLAADVVAYFTADPEYDFTVTATRRKKH